MFRFQISTLSNHFKKEYEYQNGLRWDLKIYSRSW